MHACTRAGRARPHARKPLRASFCVRAPVHERRRPFIKETAASCMVALAAGQGVSRWTYWPGCGRGERLRGLGWRNAQQRRRCWRRLMNMLDRLQAIRRWHIYRYSFPVFSCSSPWASACMPASFLVIGCCGPYSCSASPLIRQISERSLPISFVTHLRFCSVVGPSQIFCHWPAFDR